MELKFAVVVLEVDAAEEPVAMVVGTPKQICVDEEHHENDQQEQQLFLPCPHHRHHRHLHLQQEQELSLWLASSVAVVE